MISALLVTTLLGAGAPSGPEVGAALSTIRRGFLEDGDDRVTITGSHRVVSHADGSLELQGELPLRVSLQSVRRELGASCITTLRDREIDAASPLTVRSQHACEIGETWTNELGGLEHAFVLQRAPAGSGGLTLRLSVQGPWHHADVDGQIFKGPGAATGWRYGNAFVVRGDRRLPIAVVHVDGGLELRVPQAMLEAPDAFPMIIDPILAMELPLDPTANGFEALPSQEEGPAIAVNSNGMAMVVWSDNRRQFGADIFGARFNSNGGLQDNVGVPLVAETGHQLRPTICAEGTSFLIAWEQSLADGGASIRARTVTSSLGSLPAVTIIQGSQPSLATAGDAGYAVLAYVDPSAAVQVLPMVGTDAGLPFARPAVTASDTSSRPAIAASNRSWFVVWESNRTLTGAIKGMGNVVTAQPFDLSPNTAGIAARRPTVALGAEGTSDNAFIFWEQGVSTVGGARVNAGVVTALTAFTGSSPALVRTSTATSVLPTLGYFAAGALVVKDLNDGGLTSSLTAGPRPNDLVLASSGGIYAAWTEGPFGGSDVMGAALATGMNPQPLTLSQAAVAQRAPHVAMKDDFSGGIAVWIEGAHVISGARVNVQNGGVSFGSVFQIADRSQAIDQLDVAAAGSTDLYLVTWRQGGTTLLGQLATSAGKDGNLIPLSLTANVGPAVAWEGSTFVVAFSQGVVADVVSKTVAPNGTASLNASVHASVPATDLDLACRAGACLLAWSRRDLPRVEAVVIGNLTAPLIIRQMASLPTVSHDGRNFFLGWRSNTGLAFAEVDFMSGQPMDLPFTVDSGINSIGGLSLAPGVPPVLAWSDVTPGEVTNVYLQRLDVLGPSLDVAGGMLPIVATSAPQPGAQGLVVYQRYLANDGFHVMRSFGTGFTFPYDAGVVDAGVPDAGVPDAGVADASVDAGVTVVDAGLPESDGGLDGGADAPDAGVMTFQTSGCSCDAGSGAPLLMFALLMLRRRLTRAS